MKHVHTFENFTSQHVNENENALFESGTVFISDKEFPD